MAWTFVQWAARSHYDITALITCFVSLYMGSEKAYKPYGAQLRCYYSGANDPLLKAAL